MSNINRAAISGNLTRDPELRKTAGGTAVLGFGVAVNDRRKNPQTGQWEDFPNYIDCTMFGNRAQALSRILAKGDKVAVEGKLRWSQWQAQDGGNRSKIEIIVDELELMSRDAVSMPKQQPTLTPEDAARVAVQVLGRPTDGGPLVVQQMPGMTQPVAASIYDEDLPF